MSDETVTRWFVLASDYDRVADELITALARVKYLEGKLRELQALIPPLPTLAKAGEI